VFVYPRSIKHYPGVVLDVVLSTSGGDEPTTVSQISNSSIATFQHNPPSNDEDSTNSALQHSQVVGYVQKNAIESDVEQLLVASPSSDLQSKALASSTPDALVQAIKAGDLGRLGEQLIGCLQDLKNEVAKNNELVLEINQVAYENKELLIRMNDLQKALDSKQDEMKELQIQALDRLALIQNSVKILLTQTYELHEYPIPRLFIVLPDERSSWNPMDFFSNKFRLYFLCECGEHTMVTNSKIPHHIHLAKHGGYDIASPKEFFRQYGSYVLTILRMLKFGISVTGIVVPAVTLLVRDDTLHQATSSLKMLIGNISTGMDQIIRCIEDISTNEGVVDRRSGQMENNEALEGADLRQLETFLKNKDENRVLGNLYRTVTSEGHVKWVCIDHFRENYHAKAAQAFRETVDSLQGTFDENIGRAEVELKSKVQAEQFYRVLESARSVYELQVELDWDTTQNDFKMLRNTLSKTNVGVLELHLTQHGVRPRDILSRNHWNDPVLDIILLRSIQSFTIRGPCDLTKRSSLLSRKYDFPNLRHLDISLDQLKDDRLGVKCLITKSSGLSSLALGPSAGSTQVSLGDIVGDLILPPTLRHLDIPLYQLKNDIPGFKRLVTNASELSRLDLRADYLGSDNGYVLQAFNAIAEHWAYSINFKGRDLCLPPPPPRESNQSMVAQQCMEHLLGYYCATNSEQDLDRNVLKLFWKMAKSLRVPSDEDIGRVEVKLRSSAQAEHFYYALEKATSVHELRVDLDWKATQGDFEKLRDTLATTNVGALELYLMQQDGPTRDLSSCGQRYDAILDIMQHPSIQSFTIRGLRDFSKQSNLLSRNGDFSHLLHLDISLHELQSDIPGVVYLITKASNLSRVAIGTGTLEEKRDHRYILEAYNAFAKHRTYPIKFKDLNLIVPSPSSESNQTTATQQCMEYILQFYCEHGSEKLRDGLDEMAVDTLAKAIATTNGSAFKMLYFKREGQIGDSFINNISSIVGRSELHTIDILMRIDPGRVLILESIQWKHLRELYIAMKPGTFETRVMRLLVDGVTKMSEKVELDMFYFWTEKWRTPLTLPEEDLLQAFVASTSIKELQLYVDMTLEQILSLLKSTDFSRLEKLGLWAKGFDSVKVDAIIDGVGHATKLSVLELRYANITDGQTRRMKSNGITLKDFQYP